MNLRELATWWQTALGLTQWRINVEFDPSIYPPNLGMCMPMHEYWQAEIRLATPDQVPNTDVEETLVHELLHCVFAPFETKADTPERKEEERAVELLARSFVAMKRRGLGAEASFRRSVQRVIREGARARTPRQAAMVFVAERRGRKKTMDPRLVELLMQLGQFMATENLPDDLKKLISELVGYAAGGAPEDGPPSGEMPPADQGMPDDQNQPGMPPARSSARPMGAPRAPLASRVSPRQAPALGAADVEGSVRESGERSRILSANAKRPGMTPELATFREGQPLKTVRDFVSRLAPLPVAPAEGDGARARTEPAGVQARPITNAAPGTVPQTAPAGGASGIDPSDAKALGEAFALKRLPAIMGANPSHVENVRARMAAGQPVGVLTPARQAEVRALRVPGSTAATR